MTGKRNPRPNRSVDIDENAETQYYVISDEPVVGTSFGIGFVCTADLHLQEPCLHLQADDDLHSQAYYRDLSDTPPAYVRCPHCLEIVCECRCEALSFLESVPATMSEQGTATRESPPNADVDTEAEATATANAFLAGRPASSSAATPDASEGWADAEVWAAAGAQAAATMQEEQVVSEFRAAVRYLQLRYSLG